ncbi:type II toxin-antitoxin system RelE/ParE family toxin [soil metagenome]
MNNYVLAPDAEADLEAIVDYYEQFETDFGLRLVEQITLKFDLLASFPRLGKQRPKLVVELRQTVVDPCLIFYRPAITGIEVVRVLHGRRKITKRLFRKS